MNEISLLKDSRIAKLYGVLSMFSTLLIAGDAQAQTEQQVRLFKQKVKHIVVIYQENWSFDGLYGFYPGADNLVSAGVHYNQYNCRTGDATQPFVFPLPYFQEEHQVPMRELPADFITPSRPYPLDSIGVDNLKHTGDLVHRFVSEPYQIHDGKMDCFASYSDNPGLVLSYYNATELPEGKLAQRFTMCDHFFHSAFGGSYLNHMWLVAAKTPQWPLHKKPVPSAPFLLPYEKAQMRVQQGQMNGNGILFHISEKGYLDTTAQAYYPVNTIYSEQLIPYFTKANSPKIMPLLADSTIADRLNEKHISWAWFAGGWDKRNDSAYCKAASFQYHHQPFAYFERTADAPNLQDEEQFIALLKQSAAIPQVSFIKPVGRYNEHPSYASLLEGQQHIQELVQAIIDSKYFNETLIIIAYDENGGRWDHVAPPNNPKDGWGPGTRVPAILVSPWSQTPAGQKPKIDRTVYETVSILKTIELLFDLRPLTERDKDAKPMIESLDFSK